MTILGVYNVNLHSPVMETGTLREMGGQIYSSTGIELEDGETETSALEGEEDFELDSDLILEGTPKGFGKLDSTIDKPNFNPKGVRERKSKKVMLAVAGDDKYWQHCSVTILGRNENFNLFNVYKPSTVGEKRALWDLLSSKLNNITNGTCVVARDFNAILSSTEKSGGIQRTSTSQKECLDFVEQNHLLDIVPKNGIFTWTNWRTVFTNIVERLDQFLISRNPGQSGVGCILRDSDGLCLKEISKNIGVATNNEAEFRAAFRDLQLGKELGVQIIHLEGDSLNVINVICCNSIPGWRINEWLQLILALLATFEEFQWKPLQVKKSFEAQGIRGPPYRLFYGNSPDISRMINEQKSKPMPLSHDILPRVLPYYHQWSKTYGQDFIFWFGPIARLVVPHPELIKEILSTKFGSYTKPRSNPLLRQLVGQGLTGLTGEKWAQHRKIINPAFHMDLLKGMIPTIAKSSANMLDEWCKLILSGASEIEVLKEFRDLTADIIARTAFGSSFREGKKIFDMQEKQMILTSELFRSVYIPGFRFLPTTKNGQLWNVEKEIRKCVRQVIDAREKTAGMEKTGSYGADLLGLMMSESKKQMGVNLKSNASLTTEEIIDECKTFYFAGHETTSVLLTWTIVLLGIHQDWQEQGRKEVREVCGRNNYPNADSLNRLKIVGMIINEALRLYPPAVFPRRQACEPTKLGRLSIPAGIQLELPILAIHHDPALWGNDANDFNPGRFSEGISKAAKHPMAFMPFGTGPTICVGQNFALLETKLVLAMILQKFSFGTSPAYTHAPMLLVTLKPQYGAQVIFHMD
ncbi:cytochrome P450 734A1-like [Cryptomeria japonica]|uniref:cytochrome P450 734A1-like n=1 Tax=Cryptomeria japonica TaxID=3369 RepID=UPI0027D9DFDA|nr:cytochrome P450 734A1-like [Cryptomeria japonica]